MDPTLHHYIGFADGASIWSPNLTLAVWVIYLLSHELIHIDGMCVGMTTNNQDEYDGFMCLLAASLHLGIRHLYVFLESQLNKCYRVRDPCLFRKFLCTRHFEKITFMHVPKFLNSVADQMTNDVLEWHINHRI